MWYLIQPELGPGPSRFALESFHNSSRVWVKPFQFWYRGLNWHREFTQNLPELTQTALPEFAVLELAQNPSKIGTALPELTEPYETWYRTLPESAPTPSRVLVIFQSATSVWTPSSLSVGLLELEK